MPVGDCSYSGDPSSGDFNTVRFLVGDTDPDDFLLGNAEYTWLLTANGNNVYLAGADAAVRIVPILARDAGTRFKDIQFGDRTPEHFAQLATDLRGRAAVAGAIPYAGGISISDKRSRELDSDRVPPTFTRRTGLPPVSDVGLATDGSQFDETM